MMTVVRTYFTGGNVKLW